MKFRFAILALALSLAGCATLRTSDGKLNIPVILSDAQWGLTEACSQEWVPQDACVFGTDAFSTANAIALRDLPGAKQVVRKFLVDVVAKLPQDSRLRPYLDGVVLLLS